ncbi:MAG: putative TrmH family tRNA/rRNA methyltransferase [Candidatus Anoxychlamydiales bacterium]|nr:putative TrmH family tRNA/rRNA methyltransferase [Candidatus Anoxychlamydiales bacterium]
MSNHQDFTKKKFLTLDIKKQHKKLSEILRQIYEKILLKQYAEHLFKHYSQLCNWMQIDFLDSKDIKKISDRYHFHLKKAAVSLKEHNLLPTIRSIDGNNIEMPFLENAIYLDGLRSAFNVGNIIRTTEALRIGKIYFDEKTPYIDNEKVQKTSMGSYQLTKCENKFNLKDLPRPFIGLDTSEKSISIHDFIFPEKFTMILGNEEYGISDKMLKEIDYLIEIPMLGFKNSINVASAFAICSNEIRRQQKK